MVLRLWQGRTQEVLPAMMEMADGPLPLTSLVCTYLVRAGRADEARSFLVEHPMDLSRSDWFSMLNWAGAAETALGIGDPELGATAYRLLAPYPGRVACAGSGTAVGPVDAFLALAAAASGEPERAARHADDAMRLIELWGIPLAGDWLRDQRARFGF